MQIKKTITKYLLLIAIFLLFLNVVIDLVKKPQQEKTNNSYKELTVAKIDSVFLSVLYEYGIEPQWVSVKKIKVPYEDSISKQINVVLPADLPIPLIIKDVHNIIENDITGFVSEEKKQYGTTEIRIYSNELLKLKALLVPGKEIVRDRNRLAFIISDALELGQSDFSEFLSIPYILATIAVPNESTVIKVDSLRKYYKEYIVLLSNDINDKKFRLDARDQKALLRNSISNISRDFNNAKMFCVDENSRLYNSTVYNFVRDEFLKRKIVLRKQTEFLSLAGNEQEILSKFKFYCEDETGLKEKTFLLDYTTFKLIRNDLERYRKKGSRIVALSSTSLMQ